MTDSTASPGGHPDWKAMSEAAKKIADDSTESVAAAGDALKMAFEHEREAWEAWQTAMQTEIPDLREVTKFALRGATRKVTENLRILEIAHLNGASASRTLEAMTIQLLMSQAEVGAKQRALATDELLQAANSQATSLKRATWALAFATCVLAVATVVLIFVTANG